MMDILIFFALFQLLINLFLQSFGILNKLVDIILVNLIIIGIQLIELALILSIDGFDDDGILGFLDLVLAVVGKGLFLGL